MKRFATFLAALLLTLLSTNVYAQKKTDNDYNLKKSNVQNSTLINPALPKV